MNTIGTRERPHQRPINQHGNLSRPKNIENPTTKQLQKPNALQHHNNEI